MVAIKAQMFGGMVPALSSRSLPPNNAVDVVNARIHEGKITPIQQLSEQYVFPPGAGINYAVRIPDPLNTANGGFSWLGGKSMNFSFSRPAINDDLYERYVYCEGDYLNPVLPRYNTLANIRNGVADYQLGVVQPTFTPVVNVSGGAVPSASSAVVQQIGALTGINYAVGDTIVLAGGTFTQPMVLQVDEVDTPATGRIVSVTIKTPGSYSVTPPNPVLQATTSGQGLGAGFTLTFGNQGAEIATVVAQGTNYATGDTIIIPGGTFTQQCTVEVGTLANATALVNGVPPTTGPIQTAFVLIPGIYTALPSNPVTQQSTSGAGTGAAFDLTFTGQQGLTAVVYSTGASGGGGYAVGDTITLVGGTLTSAATPAVLTVSSVTVGGVVTGVYVSTPGAYAALPTNPVAQGSTSGLGVGAEFNVTWTIEQAVIAIPANVGSGYAVGDVLTVVGGTFTEAAEFTVATLSVSGVATVTISSPGAYTVYPASPVAVTGGKGTGATFNVAWGNQNPTETRAYVCTYVDIYGQESAPTNGGTGTGETDGTWNITALSMPVSNPGAPLMGINLYRTITVNATDATYYFVGVVPVAGAQSGAPAPAGSGYAVGDTVTLAGGIYSVAAELMVTEISMTGGILAFEVLVPGLYTLFPGNPAAQASTSGNGAGATFTITWISSGSSFLDTTDDQTLSLEAVQLQTVGWIPPVAMEGFISVPNGFLCGWAGNQIYFSQPGAPWAWPVAYQMSVDAQIVGMGYLDGSIVVLTTSSPFQLTGTIPSAMTSVKISTLSPCTSRGSVCQAIDGVNFATRNGIVNSSPLGFVNISDKVISTEVWRQEYFSNIIAGVRYEDTYMGLVGPGEGYILAIQGYTGGYFDNPQNVRIALSRFLLAEEITNMFQDPFSSAIFMMANGTVYMWDDPKAGTTACRFKSKEFASSQPINMAVYLCALDVPTAGPQNTDEVPSVAFDIPTDPSVPTPTEFEAMGAETSLIGYSIIGAALIGSGVLPGAVPPGMGSDPNAPVYPFWPGLLVFDPSAGAGGAGPGGSADPDWELVPQLPYGAQAYLEVYANRSTVYRGAINSNAQTRLPAGFKSTLWQFAITSSVPVWSIAMATSAKELKNAQ